MNNIYDLFNERKSGIDALVEGVQFEDEQVEEAFDYEDIEPFESIEEALETLDEVITDSNNELMELRAAQYLESLVLENMMYDDFDEEKMSGLIEAAEGGKVEAFKKRINELWNKIKAWFAATIKAVRNHFISGGKLVAENDSKIGPAMHLCDVKVKINDWKPLSKALKALEATMNQLKATAFKDTTKEQALKRIGAKDLKDIPGIVKLMFMNREGREMKISDINVDMAKQYAAGGEATVGALEVIREEYNKQFQEVLDLVKKTENAENLVTVFNFKITMQSNIMKAAIECAKKAGKDYTAVIRKALAAKLPKEDKEDDEPKEDKKEEKPKKEKKSFKDLFGKKNKKKDEDEPEHMEGEVVDDDK